ncbi:MAG TPA: type II toxin-antitoxin system VapC family toxin [Verrucomicrobiae bacterium]|jgi:hypothetical protein
MSIYEWFVMITAVDTSVLLDVLLNDPAHAAKSLAVLRQAVAEGTLIIGAVALAELIPALKPEDVSRFLAEWNISFVPESEVSAVLAGQMFSAYLSRGGLRGRVVPDFLIAAHAQTSAQRLLARDRGYYRDYFHQLTVWDPSRH